VFRRIKVIHAESATIFLDNVKLHHEKMEKMGENGDSPLILILWGGNDPYLFLIGRFMMEWESDHTDHFGFST
jgi:hypothetical protein